MYKTIYYGRSGGIIRESADTINEAKKIALANKYSFSRIIDANECVIYDRIIEKEDGSHCFSES